MPLAGVAMTPSSFAWELPSEDAPPACHGAYQLTNLPCRWYAALPGRVRVLVQTLTGLVNCTALLGVVTLLEEALWGGGDECMSECVCVCVC